jgi:hypothetical protein
MAKKAVFKTDLLPLHAGGVPDGPGWRRLHVDAAGPARSDPAHVREYDPEIFYHRMQGATRKATERALR